MHFHIKSIRLDGIEFIHETSNDQTTHEATKNIMIHVYPLHSSNIRCGFFTQMADPLSTSSSTTLSDAICENDVSPFSTFST